MINASFLVYLVASLVCQFSYSSVCVFDSTRDMHTAYALYGVGLFDTRVLPVRLALPQQLVGWLVGCLTPQQHASVSQGRICSDNLTCCHTEIEVADPTFYLTQSQYTDTGPTSPSADPRMPGAWQGSHWSANF